MKRFETYIKERKKDKIYKFYFYLSLLKIKIRRLFKI